MELYDWYLVAGFIGSGTIIGCCFTCLYLYKRKTRQLREQERIYLDTIIYTNRLDV
jgi:hypothetical protein